LGQQAIFSGEYIEAFPDSFPLGDKVDRTSPGFDLTSIGKLRNIKNGDSGSMIDCFA